MRFRSGILLISLVVAVLAAMTFFYVWEQPLRNGEYRAADQFGTQTGNPNGISSCSVPLEANASSTLVGRYVDQRLNFSLAIPDGYRVADDLMWLLDGGSGEPVNGWSPQNSQAVVLTASASSTERAFEQAAVSGISWTDITHLPQTIYITALSQSLASIEKTLIAPYCSLTLAGVSAIRYTDLANESVVAVPYPAVSGASGTIFIKMNNSTETFDPSAFDTVIRTFSFVKT